MATCLPSTLSQFREQLFWDCFFTERKGNPFEWYGSFKDFREALGALGLLEARTDGEEGPLVLHVGCGNSSLPKELYDEGYKRIINVDFSPVVIEEMKSRWAAYPSLQWRCLDIRGRGLQDAFLGSSGASFDVVFDKGFLDAYLSVDHEEAVLSEAAPKSTVFSNGASTDNKPLEGPPYDYRKAAAEYFEAVLELLKDGGSFILISLAQDYVLKEFVSMGFKKKGAPGFSYEEFWVSGFWWFKCWCSRFNYHVPSGLTAPWLAPQAGEALRHFLSGNSRALEALACSQSPGKRVVLHVGGGGGMFARCNVAVYDTTNKAHAEKKQTAALLVPPGQELNWTFASPEGNQQVTEQLEAARLLVVTFPLGFGSEEIQDFPPLQWQKTIEEAQKTLGPLLKEFALPNNDVIPILTLGDQAPVREVLWQQSSPLAGRILVRDVQDSSAGDSIAMASEGSVAVKNKKKAKNALLARKEKDRNHQRLLRQLLFSCNSSTTQSEIKIRVPKGASSTDESQVEFVIQDPASAYHCAIVTAFGFSSKVVSAPWGATKGVDAVLLGLGGGVLGGLLHYLFGHIGLSLTCVELDPVVIDIAKKFFGFKETEAPMLKVVCAEGKQYVKSLPDESTDLIIIDINSGEAGDVIICPPKAFAQADFLEAAKQKLRPGGVLITNLLCRCKDTKSKLLDSIMEHFSSLAVITVPEDVNEVAVAVKQGCSPQGSQGSLSGSELLKRLQHLERCFLQHTGGKGGWMVGQTTKDWVARVRPWPLPKSSTGKNDR